MYQNVGLPTPRGSGTSGYIQRNLSYVPPKRTDKEIPDGLSGDKAPRIRKANPELLRHEEKRKVEVKVLELEEQLASEGASAAKIKRETESLRKKLLKRADTDRPDMKVINSSLFSDPSKLNPDK
eukprot:GHVU01132784.1.p4 GENE.GHVU01132784.1~~GHVU01132784.1.p4  ORF type:complete len:125 (+),score=20.11 GHVU01132784.1:731-1105(+)